MRAPTVAPPHTNGWSGHLIANNQPKNLQCFSTQDSEVAADIKHIAKKKADGSCLGYLYLMLSWLLELTETLDYCSGGLLSFRDLWMM